MKKWFLTAMLLCLCLTVTTALAANATILVDGEYGQDYRNVTDMVCVGDKAYFLAYTHAGEEIWYWREGMAEAEKAAEGLVRAADFSCIEDAANAVGPDRAKYAITLLLSDGERLLGLNHLNGLVYQIGFQDGAAKLTDVVYLADTNMLYWNDGEMRWFWNPRGVAVSGGYLYWHSSGWSEELRENRERVTRISLMDGSATDIEVENLRAVSSYKEGKLLILQWDMNGRIEENGQAANALLLRYVLSIYDPADGSITEVGRFETAATISRIVYAPELDAVLYQDSTSIMGVKLMGEPKRYAYVNTTVSSEMGVIGNQLIMSTTTESIVRDLVEGLTAPESLQVTGTSYGVTERSFAEKYPLVPIEIVQDRDDAGLVKLLAPVEGEEAVDAVRLSVGRDSRSEFGALKEAELLMDLSGNPEIKAYVDALYPVFRELVTGDNGEIWAVPTSAFGYSGFFVNRKALADTGLTMEEMPTNLVELCEFVTRWNNEFADRFPNYACIEYTEDTRSYMLDMALEMWIDHCRAAGEELRFDDPMLREALAAIDKMETARTDAGMRVTNPEISDYKTGVFWMNCKLVGNWASYMEEYSDRVFVPFTLTEDAPFHAWVDYVELWAVNRYTESEEFSIKLLQEQVADVSTQYRHVLLTTETEPVENSYYPANVEQEEERLTLLQKRLACAETEQERADAQAQIEAQERYMAGEMKRGMYTVSPTAIENYIEAIVPAMAIAGGETIISAYDLQQAKERWLEGKISTEQFIRELDTRLLMQELSR